MLGLILRKTKDRIHPERSPEDESSTRKRMKHCQEIIKMSSNHPQNVWLQWIPKNQIQGQHCPGKIESLHFILNYRMSKNEPPKWYD